MYGRLPPDGMCCCSSLLSWFSIKLRQSNECYFTRSGWIGSARPNRPGAPRREWRHFYWPRATCWRIDSKDANSILVSYWPVDMVTLFIGTFTGVDVPSVKWWERHVSACAAPRSMQSPTDSPAWKKCITEHPGFVSVCLDPWVLEMAYYGYRRQYGSTIFRDHSLPE